MPVPEVDVWEDPLEENMMEFKKWLYKSKKNSKTAGHPKQKKKNSDIRQNSKEEHLFMSMSPTKKKPKKSQI